MERLSLESDFDGERAKNSRKAGRRLKALEDELSELRARQSVLELKWKQERGNVEEIKAIRERLESLDVEVADAERTFDLSKAAELKFSVMPGLKKQLAMLEAAEDAASDGDSDGAKMLRDEVSIFDVCSSV